MSLSSMMDMRNLLVELFVEELPPKALKKLGEAFAAALLDGLRTQGLASAQSATTAFATPRRLAAHVSRVLEQAADRSVVHKLMPAAVGLDAAGQPTPALKKKLAALGADDAAAARIERRVDGKADTLFLPAVVPGARLADGLQTALDAAIAQLPIPKTMTYQLDDGWTSVQFVRPLHGLVALHGADVVAVRVLGHDAGRQTRGHRFEAAMEPVVLQDADHYAQQLEAQGAVIASFAQRRGEIARQLQRVAAEQGLTPIADDALLDEVTALVERPNVLLCRFDPAFLAVPAECLILTMKANQKYFPLLDGDGRLTDRFLVVSNIRPDDAGAVITGNQRVVRPRLADAKFFFDQDRKQSLESRLPRLDKVVYHAKLGSLGERVQRVRAIARAIGEQLGGPALAQQADRAAQLAKADLLTDMVGEFPELQGVMGGYYARHDGESEAVAFAVEDHYKPRFAGDQLPRNEVGLVVALADKLETLVGLFGIGEKPTGDKDPFALRRHALGVIRMLTERDLPLRLDLLLDLGVQAFERGSIGEAQTDIASFVFERFAGQLREQGYTSGEVDAVLSMRPVQLNLVPRQLEAVRAFAAMQEAPALASANKRVGNILKKADAVLSTWFVRAPMRPSTAATTRPACANWRRSKHPSMPSSTA
jgi:glycyl-tRNA synthetase beta chain